MMDAPERVWVDIVYATTVAPTDTERSREYVRADLTLSADEMRQIREALEIAARNEASDCMSAALAILESKEPKT